MPTVETLNGKIDVAKLGPTLMHEHIVVQHKEMQENYPHPEWNEEAVIKEAREGLERLSGLGIKSLVDLTCFGLGRDVPIIQRICEGLDFNVIVATGFYTFNELPKYFHLHGPGKRYDIPDPLNTLMLRDIREGIAHTGVKAGIIKIGTDAPGFTPDVTRVFKATVAVHLETGVPISTHTLAKDRGGLAQLKLFKDEGANLSKVVIGHCGDTTDLDYLCELLDAGVQIGMDRFGLHNFLGTEARIDTVVKLCARGYASQMTLSQDAGFYSATSAPSSRAKNQPEWTHFLISEKVLPELRKRGVTEEQIDLMMVQNPIRILGIA